MKVKLFSGGMILLLLLGLYSCDNKRYYEFTAEEAEFMAYEKGQIIKFKDTSDVTHIMEQTKHLIGYFEDNHIFGTDFIKEYEVTYQSISDPSFIHAVVVGADHSKFSGGVNVRLGEYQAPDPYSTTTLSLPTLKETINGKEYTKVHKLKAIRWRGYRPPLSDTATMYFNKEYGLLKVLFPSGKSITRVD